MLTAIKFNVSHREERDGPHLFSFPVTALRQHAVEVGPVPSSCLFYGSEGLGKKKDWKKKDQNVNTGFVEEVCLANFDFIFMHFLNWL